MEVPFFGGKLFCRTSPKSLLVLHKRSNTPFRIHTREDATRETHVAVAKRVAKNGPVEELS